MFEYLLKNKITMLITILLLGVFFQFSLNVIFSLIYRNHSLVSSLSSYLISIGISFVVIFGLILLMKWLNKRYSWEEAPGNRFYIQVILVVAFVILVVQLIRTTLNLAFYPDGFIRLLDEIIITVYFFVISLLMVFLDMGINLLNKWRYSLVEIERFRNENLAAQFEALRMQVNPHFLFNSLNTLSSLIYQDQDTASNFVRELSTVYRYILEKRKDEVVTLEEEMKFSGSFQYLLELRFKNKLIFNIDVDEPARKMMIVPLTLQILIENAVKHNIVSAKKPLTIDIFVEENKVLVVSNTLQKKNVDSASTGIGLENIRSRLALLSDREMDVEESDGNYVVRVPLLEKDELKLSELSERKENF